MKTFMKKMAIAFTIVSVIGFVGYSGFFLHKKMYPPVAPEAKATWSEKVKKACGIEVKRPPIYNPNFLDRVDYLFVAKKTVDNIKNPAPAPEPTYWEKTKTFSNNSWVKTKNVTSNSWDKTKNFTSNSWDKTKSFSNDAWKKISPEKTKS